MRPAMSLGSAAAAVEALARTVEESVPLVDTMVDPS